MHFGQATDLFGPFQGVHCIFHAKHRRRVDGGPLEDVEGNLAAPPFLARLGHAEELGHRPGGRVALQAGYRAGREHQHAVGGFPAQRLLPGKGHGIEFGPVEVLGEGRRGGVANDDAFTVGGDEISIGHAYARRRAVPSEDQVGIGAHLAEVRQLAIWGVEHFGGQLELLDHVGHPILAEAFEGQELHRLGTEHGPHSHLDGTGIGAGDDADQEVVGNLQHLTSAGDCLDDARLAQLGAMRTTEHGVAEIFGGPSGTFSAGAGRKFGSSRPHGWLSKGIHSDVSHPYR